MSNKFVEQPMKYIPMGPSYYQAMNPMINLISGKQNPMGIASVIPPGEQKINDSRGGKVVYHPANQMLSHPVTVISQQQRLQMMKETQKIQ